MDDFNPFSIDTIAQVCEAARAAEVIRAHKVAHRRAIDAAYRRRAGMSVRAPTLPKEEVKARARAISAAWQARMRENPVHIEARRAVDRALYSDPEYRANKIAAVTARQRIVAQEKKERQAPIKAARRQRIKDRQNDL